MDFGKRKAEDTAQKTDLNVGVNVGANVGVNEQKLLNLISKDSAITAITASEVLSISKRQIERLLSSLKNKGLIRRIGADKGGHWEVVSGAENK